MRIIIFILPFVLLSAREVHAQTTYNTLILGEWTYVSQTKGYHATIHFTESGSFEMNATLVDGASMRQSGLYELNDSKLTLRFESGSTQVNDIEVLNNETLRFRYIETIYRYTRQDF